MEASYAYRPDGLRASKTVNDVEAGFVWDSSQTILETEDSTVKAQYVCGVNLVASRMDGLIISRKVDIA